MDDFDLCSSLGDASVAEDPLPSNRRAESSSAERRLSSEVLRVLCESDFRGWRSKVLALPCRILLNVEKEDFEENPNEREAFGGGVGGSSHGAMTDPLFTERVPALLGVGAVVGV